MALIFQLTVAINVAINPELNVPFARDKGITLLIMLCSCHKKCERPSQWHIQVKIIE